MRTKRSLFASTLDFLEGVSSLPLPYEQLDLVVKVYHDSGLLGLEEWENVPLHCVLVAKIADRLSAMCQVIEKDELLLAALFHDALKHGERSRTKELREATQLSEGNAFALAAVEQSQFLARVGVPDKVVAMSKLSGHTSLAYFRSGKANLEESIFHIADDLAGGEDGTVVVMIDDRMADLAIRYPFMLTDGRDELNGETYLEVQRRLAKGILDMLAQYGGYANGEHLNGTLVEEFKHQDHTV